MKLKKLIILLFLSLFSLPLSVLSQREVITTYGPNLGIITNDYNKRDIYDLTYTVGFSVRRTKKWRYIQPEVNIVISPDYSKLSGLRVPILYGVRILKTVKFNVGAELQTNVKFVGMNHKGLNDLSYTVLPETSITPVVGTGIDISKFFLDLRIGVNSTGKELQYLLSTGFLFGKNDKKNKSKPSIYEGLYP